MATPIPSPTLTASDAWRISPPGRRHWFPRLFTLVDGSLLQFDSTVDDAIEAIRHEQGSSWRRSFDGGRTWQEFATPSHEGYPVILSDGRVRIFSYILWQRDDGQVYGLSNDWMPSDADWSAPQPFLVNIPPTKLRPNGVSGMVVDRTVLRQPDGSLLATLYGHLAGQEKYNCMLVRSVDEGRTWDFVSIIAYDATIPGEGFCEPVLARVADGSLLTVMRTGGGMERKYPMYQSRSLDSGFTWSAPEELGVYSVDPDLCLMDNGLLVCSYGRPTIEMMASSDGSGYAWSQPTTIFTGNSTCYSGLRQVAAGRLLLVYDSNHDGSPWQAHDNQINAVYIEVETTTMSTQPSAPNLSAPVREGAQLVLDVRALPGAAETIAYKDGGLFPVLARSGDTVVATLRGGAGHLGLDGRMEIIRSLDGGRTWSPPAVVADSAVDDRNPAFGVTQSGTLVLSYHRQGNYDAAGNWLHREAMDDRRVEVMVTRSHDRGLTWETPYPLGVDLLAAGSPYGKIVTLADGTLIMPIYAGPLPALLGSHAAAVTGEGDCSYLVRSHDDGITWGEPALIGVNKNETALIALPAGDLLAVMRSIPPDQALYSSRSSDGGHTWSPPVQITGAHQHPADLVQLGNGDILLTYGNRTAPYRIEGKVSRDGGRTWLAPLLTFSAPLYGYDLPPERPTDLGYPSSVVRRGAGGGQGVTMYYYNPSVRKPWQHENRIAETRYLARDYYAIAVTWDEAELIAAVDNLIG